MSCLLRGFELSPYLEVNTCAPLYPLPQQVASFVVQAVSALASPDADVGTASASVFQALGKLLASKPASHRRLLGSASFDLSALANIQALLSAIVSDNAIALKAGVASNTQLAAVISYMQVGWSFSSVCVFVCAVLPHAKLVVQFCVFARFVATPDRECTPMLQLLCLEPQV